LRALEALISSDGWRLISDEIMSCIGTELVALVWSDPLADHPRALEARRAEIRTLACVATLPQRLAAEIREMHEELEVNE